MGKKWTLLLITIFSVLSYLGAGYVGAASVTIRYRITITTRTRSTDTDNTNYASLERKKITLYKGDKYKLRLDGASKKVKWTTSNRKVIRLKKKGNTVLVIAKKPGKAKIKAIYKGKSFTCKVKVLKGKGDYVSLNSYGAISLKEKNHISEEITVETTQDCNMTFEIKDPNLVSCRWGEVYNNTADSGFGQTRKLIISIADTAHTGSTSVIIKNNRNANEMDVIPVNVQMLLTEGISDYIVVPNESKSIELRESLINNKSISIRTSSNCDISYEIENPKLIKCSWGEESIWDAPDGYNKNKVLNISIAPGAINGNTSIILKNSKNASERDVINVSVKIRKKTITSDVQNNIKVLRQYLIEKGKISQTYIYFYDNYILTIEENGDSIIGTIIKEDSWSYTKMSVDISKNPIAPVIDYSDKDTGLDIDLRNYRSTATVYKSQCTEKANLDFNVISNSGFSNDDIQRDCNKTFNIFLSSINNALPSFPNYIGDDITDYSKMVLQDIGFSKFPISS